MSCSNYIAKTFGHVGGLLAVTAVGTQSELVNKLYSAMTKESKLAGQIGFMVVLIGIVMGMLAMQPGPLKYLVAIGVTLFLGSTLYNLVKELKLEGTLQKTLVQTVAISVAMIVLAFLDSSGRFLRFLPVLLAGLTALVLVNLYYYFANKERPDYLSTIGAALFTLFIAADTQVLREAAKLCKKPDYINESFNLYLDILNLFVNLADD